MSKLALAIDTMRQPEFPDNFNELDCRSILEAIETAKHRARPYRGDFKAPWLLSPYEAPQWKTTNRGREDIVNNEWRNTIDIDWEVGLPNGHLLTDHRYQKLLDANKQAAFLVRSGFVRGISSPIAWRDGLKTQLQLSRWVVLHERQYLPETFAFRLLDQSAFDSLIRTIAEGGWTSALQHPQRLLSKFYKGALGKPCPKNIFAKAYDLPEEVRTEIVKWLTSNDYYGVATHGPYAGKAYLKRSKLADAIGESTAAMQSGLKLSAFCRQFEPDFQANGLLISVYQETEKPDHKTETIKDVISRGSSENTVRSVSNNLKTLLSAHRHIPELLPEPSLISIHKAYKKSLIVARPAGHHKFIPIDLGLTYLNHAMRFVNNHGEAIVDYYLSVVKAISISSGLESTVASAQALRSGAALDSLLFQVEAASLSTATALGINKFERGSPCMNFAQIRNEPTLDEALRVLIGACVVCIAVMKPSREEELRYLKRDCLLNDGHGYYLRFLLGKSNVGEGYLELKRPIPIITAKAIQLLQKLGKCLSELFDDKGKTNTNLFYIPKVGEVGALIPKPDLLNRHLDNFCDYVGLPTDEFGRRWYVRIHEMRKWFLLLLFWSGRFGVLDAARWIAGQIDASHIYAYLELEFPGEELPMLEAEYAIDRLRAIDSKGGKADPNESGLDALYETVLQHFNVQSLSMIAESDWGDFVTRLRSLEGFYLEPHSVYSENGEGESIGINVSFVLRETPQ